MGGRAALAVKTSAVFSPRRRVALPFLSVKTSTLALSGLVLAAVVVTAVHATGPEPAHRQGATQAAAKHGARTSHAATVTSHPQHPGRPHSLVAAKAPAGAVAVADAYATSAFSTRAGASSTAWIRSVAPLCTRAWLATLTADERSVSIDSATSMPHVEQNYPSHAAQGDVAVTVQLSGEGPVSGPAVYVELTDDTGHYLVTSSQ